MHIQVGEVLNGDSGDVGSIKHWTVEVYDPNTNEVRGTGILSKQMAE